MKTLVVIKTRFDAVHNWPDCDINGVDFLEHPHRHMFYVVMKFIVTHSNRDIEFLTKKKEVDKFIDLNYKGKYVGPRSCEDLAGELLRQFDASFVSVFEDDENGAECYNEQPNRNLL